MDSLFSPILSLTLDFSDCHHLSQYLGAKFYFDYLRDLLEALNSVLDCGQRMMESSAAANPFRAFLAVFFRSFSQSCELWFASCCIVLNLILISFFLSWLRSFWYQALSWFVCDTRSSHLRLPLSLS